MKKLFILANGAIASALAQGLRGEYEPIIIGRSRDKLAPLAADFETMLYEDFDPAGRDVILAFKPAALGEVAGRLSGRGEARIIISVLANINFENLSCLSAKNYALAMPNLAAAYRASTTPFLIKNENFREEIIQIISTIGRAVELENFAQMSAAMALAGCAPAFLALIAEAMSEAGVAAGLNKGLSQKLCEGVFESFNSLFSREDPTVIRAKICSPAGVTIRGICELENHSTRAAIINAVLASAGKK